MTASFLFLFALIVCQMAMIQPTNATKIGINNVDAAITNLYRIDEWELCKGNNTDIDLDASFELSVDQAQLNNLEDLMMVIKFSF